MAFPRSLAKFVPVSSRHGVLNSILHRVCSLQVFSLQAKLKLRFLIQSGTTLQILLVCLSQTERCLFLF